MLAGKSFYDKKVKTKIIFFSHFQIHSAHHVWESKSENILFSQNMWIWWVHNIRLETHDLRNVKKIRIVITYSDSLIN